MIIFTFFSQAFSSKNGFLNSAFIDAFS